MPSLCGRVVRADEARKDYTMKDYARLEPGEPIGFGIGSIGIGLFVINAILRSLFIISMKTLSRRGWLPRQKIGCGVVRGVWVRMGWNARLDSGGTINARLEPGGPRGKESV